MLFSSLQVTLVTGSSGVGYGTTAGFLPWFGVVTVSWDVSGSPCVVVVLRVPYVGGASLTTTTCSCLAGAAHLLGFDYRPTVDPWCSTLPLGFP